jgi:hypothetical protein
VGAFVAVEPGVPVGTRVADELGVLVNNGVAVAPGIGVAVDVTGVEVGMGVPDWNAAGSVVLHQPDSQGQTKSRNFPCKSKAA